MWNWVYILFWQKVNIIRLSIWKMDGFSPVKVKSIYIWNLLLKSFPAIGCMMGKGDYNKSYILLFFGKEKSETAIPHRNGKWKNVEKSIF